MNFRFLRNSDNKYHSMDDESKIAEDKSISLVESVHMHACCICVCSSVCVCWEDSKCCNNGSGRVKQRVRDTHHIKHILSVQVGRLFMCWILKTQRGIWLLGNVTLRLIKAMSIKVTVVPLKKYVPIGEAIIITRLRQ